MYYVYVVTPPPPVCMYVYTIYDGYPEGAWGELLFLHRFSEQLMNDYDT